MKRLNATHILWGLAFASLLIGLLLMVHTLGGRNEAARRLATKEDYLQRLASLGQAQQHAQELRQTFEALSPDSIRPLRALFEASFTNRVYAPSAITASPATTGWFEWSTTLNLDAVAPTEALAFIRTLASQLPPWTVSRCEVTAAAQPKGLVRVSMGLSTLRRDSWPALEPIGSGPITP